VLIFVLIKRLRIHLRCNCSRVNNSCSRMELEHTNLGNHCEAELCNQRDFLPFTCDVCQKKFCLSHRTYAAHDCIGASSKDMTSIECPVCLKTVKFAKSDNVDAVWNDHFVSSCSGEPAKKKEIRKCYHQSCNIHLGPSNTFECRSCRQQVCMSHRRPEDHGCQGMRGAILSKLPPAVAAPAAQPKIAQSTATSKIKSTSTTSAPNKLPQNKTPMTSSSVSCPFCGIGSETSADLERHISSAHPETPFEEPRNEFNSRVSPPLPASSSGLNKISSTTSLGREVCPICQARFVDPVDLVTHFEQVHPSTNGANSTKAGSTDCIIG
jgi:predicted nucleic acid binding AN1-type Zn finger protein